LFNFRGVAASFRFKHLFLCNSLVLHVGQEWTEFFYRVMTPWKHFVPVPPEAKENDIRDLLMFLRAFPSVSQAIALNGRDFILEHLRMEDVDCYWRSLLREYASRQDFAVEPDPGATEIPSLN
jgi:protein glucosyltransferase